MLIANESAPRDNRELEARADVLVYTSAVLDREVEVIGPVTAIVYVRGSRPYFDIFVRLCDVEPSGRSLNLCDGLTRVTPAAHSSDVDETTAVAVEVWPWPTGSGGPPRARAGDGGAHPRYARNTGTDQPLASAVALHPVDVEVWHDAERPSAIVLPRHA